MAELTDDKTQDLFDKHLGDGSDSAVPNQLIEQVLRAVEETYGTGKNEQKSEPEESKPTPVPN